MPAFKSFTDAHPSGGAPGGVKNAHSHFAHLRKVSFSLSQKPQLGRRPRSLACESEDKIASTFLAVEASNR